MSKTLRDAMLNERVLRPAVHIVVDDPDSVEVMQSASIVYRELCARGLKVTMNHLAETDVAVCITIGNRGLQEGAVDFITRGPESDLREVVPYQVALEDAVEKAWEFVHEKY